jgi:hypothetical protein
MDPAGDGRDGGSPGEGSRRPAADHGCTQTQEQEQYFALNASRLFIITSST